MSKFKEWVIDAGHSGLIPLFCPYDRKKHQAVIGMGVFTDRCPGKLVGVIHYAGQDAVEKWINENPDWKERYGKLTPSEFVVARKNKI